MESQSIRKEASSSDLANLSQGRVPTSETLTLSESFQHYFNLDLATTLEQKQSVYRIRYRVYCEEFGYEPADRFPEKMETDEFDEFALHCLITHKSSGIPAGCVRVVRASGDAETDPLPLEKYCREIIDTKYVEILNVERDTVGEISRLAVDRAFRKRSGEALTRFGEVDAVRNCSQHERRSFSLIAVAGFLASVALGELTGRSGGFAMMEPFLPRLMKRSGIVFNRAGKDINYHGIRAPYFVRTQSALNGMRPDLRGLYDWTRDQIGKSLTVTDNERHQRHFTTP